MVWGLAGEQAKKSLGIARKTDTCPLSIAVGAHRVLRTRCQHCGDRVFYLRGTARAGCARTSLSPSAADLSRVARDLFLIIAFAPDHFPDSNRNLAEADATQHLGRQHNRLRIPRVSHGSTIRASCEAVPRLQTTQPLARNIPLDTRDLCTPLSSGTATLRRPLPSPRSIATRRSPAGAIPPFSERRCDARGRAIRARATAPRRATPRGDY